MLDNKGSEVGDKRDGGDKREKALERRKERDKGGMKEEEEG